MIVDPAFLFIPLTAYMEYKNEIKKNKIKQTPFFFRALQSLYQLSYHCTCYIDVNATNS